MLLFYLLICVSTLMGHQFWADDSGAFTPVKYLGAACLLAAIAKVLITQTIPPMLSAVTARLYVLLVVIAMFSWLAKGSPSSAGIGYNPFTSYISFLMLLFITSALVDNVSRLRWTLVSCVAGAAIGSLYVLREWQKYGASMGEGFRPGSVVGDPNYFSVVAVICVPLAICFAQKENPLWQRIFCLGSAGITAFAVMVTASRAGFVALGLSLLAVAVRFRHWFLNLLVVGCLMVVLIILYPSPWRRLMEPSRSDRVSTEIRLQYWRAGMEMMRDYPLFGIGLGNFKRTVGRYETLKDIQVQGIAHNSYVEAGAELGLPALLLLLLIFGGTLYSLEKVRRKSKAVGATLIYQGATGIQAGLLGAYVATAFVSGQYQKLFWVIMFVTMRMPTLLPAKLAVACNESGAENAPAVQASGESALALRN